MDVKKIQDIWLRYLRKERVTKEEEDRLFKYYEEHIAPSVTIKYC